MTLGTPPLLITGAPRSGTSLIAGICQKMGMWTGHTVEGAPTNPRGFFENWGIREMIIKRQLVQLNGDLSGVLQLPTLDSVDQLSADGMLAAVEGSMRMEGYPAGARWLYKDAKLALLWPVWLKAFPDAKWLIVRRNDADIIQSCLRTDFMRQHSSDFEFWRDWLQEYYDRLEKLSEALDPEHVRVIYPAKIIEDRDYEGLESLAEWLKLEFDPGMADGFIIPEAWHGTPEGQEPIFSKTVLNTELTMVEDHVRTNLARKLPSPPPAQPHDLEVCIVAGGRSLSRQLGNIRKAKRRGASIMTVNGTHNFLIRQGIIPDALIVMDAREEDRNVEMVAKPHDDVAYFLASQCDPRVFDAVADKQCFIWHSAASLPWEELFTEADVDHPVLQGGTTVGMKALTLAMYLGFRQFHLYGFDSCIWENNKHHAYKQTLNDQDVDAAIPLHIGERTFKCAGWMVRQVEDFKEFCDAWGGEVRLRVHGDGALAEIVREGARQEKGKAELMKQLSVEKESPDG